jgi:hypothetical protein
VHNERLASPSPSSLIRKFAIIRQHSSNASSFSTLLFLPTIYVYWDTIMICSLLDHL